MMNLSPRFSSARAINGFALPITIAICALLTFPGCCLPKLSKPDPAPALPDSFNGAVTADNSSQLCWREFFSDPTFVSLIDQALAGNQELKILNQRVQAANFEVLGRSGAYLPFVNWRAGASLEKPGLYTPLGAVEDQLDVMPGKPFPEPLPDFLVATEITWEVDIWRRLRNARDASTLRYLGTADGQNYIITRLVAEIGEKYYELMALDNRMATLDLTIQIQERSLEVSKAKKEAGRDTELPVQRFEAEVRKNQSEKLIIQQEIVEAENRINFLLGRYPQRVERDSSRFLDLHLNALAVGVPAQLLQNRADIRQAERELQAAGLDVKIARARFFPSLNINAAVGYEAFNPRYLFNTPESLIYNVAGDLVGPLINRRAIKADYLTANAVQLEKVYDYQRTVLNAFTEVVNRIAKVQNYGQSIAVKREQLKALEDSVDIATKLFQAAHPGVEYMDVLLAQRDFMDAKLVLIDTKQQQLAAIINAYQALGGGGVPPEQLLSGGNCNVPPPMSMPAMSMPGEQQLMSPTDMPPPATPESIPPGQPFAPGMPFPPPAPVETLQPELLPPGARYQPPPPAAAPGSPPQSLPPV